MLSDMQVRAKIGELKTFWNSRNTKFKEWFDILVLIDVLASKRMESYVSNEPMTFYNMAHYLLTKGELTHTTPIETESGLELDRIARINRGCSYMWNIIDRDRQLGGNMPFIDELGFFLLILGWYSLALAIDEKTGKLIAQIWSPINVYPEFSDNKISSCVHSYTLTDTEAKFKASNKKWEYSPSIEGIGQGQRTVTLDDFFVYEGDNLYNKIYIDGKCVTGNEWIERNNMKLLTSPVGGFPDKGSLTKGGRDWKKLTGRGIFAVNEGVTLSFNKWKTMVTQILRDTAQPITQEFSATPQATPEQLRERGALFHYGVGEVGLQRVPAPNIPLEVQSNLLELRREMQKGSFNDSVYGMVEGQPGYALSLLASSSANQILYPYMDAKHFVIAESDRFWLSNLKSSNKTFVVSGKFLEKIQPEDITEDIHIEVNSDVATPKDWMERGTIAGMLKGYLDKATIITEILRLSDPQGIKRRMSVDDLLEHPMSKMVEMIAGYHAHADYLQHRGDLRQAALFRKAADRLEQQLGAPPAGAAKPPEAQGEEVPTGASEKRTPVNSNIAPPETRGFTPQQLRQSIGRGSVRGI